MRLDHLLSKEYKQKYKSGLSLIYKVVKMKDRAANSSSVLSLDILLGYSIDDFNDYRGSTAALQSD